MNGDIERETEAASLFPLSIAKISVAQICRSIGFTRAQPSALEALTNIATRFLQALAKSASSSANSCNRTECNLFDVFHAIENMNSIQGFPGASDINRSVLNSGILRELMKFVKCIDEIPFAKPIPRGSPVLPDPSTYKGVGTRVCERTKSNGNIEESDQFFNRAPVKVMDCKEDMEKRILPDGHPRVRFKLGLGFRVESSLKNRECKGAKKGSSQSLIIGENICFKRSR